MRDLKIEYADISLNRKFLSSKLKGDVGESLDVSEDFSNHTVSQKI